MTSSLLYPCPLCAGVLGARWQQERTDRQFFECPQCDLLYAHPSEFPSVEQARQRYDLHQNDVSNAGYVAFLSRLRNELLPFIQPKMSGLDFGAGPSKVLCQLFRDSGYSLEPFDPIYGPVIDRERVPFDFITCSEVVEHFEAPLAEFRLIHKLLRPQGILGILTKLRDDFRNDPGWWYLRDSTHVAFYSTRTFAWICQQIGFNSVKVCSDMLILAKA